MKNRILLAMSTLPPVDKLKAGTFSINFLDGINEKVGDCIGQLEPTVKYILRKLPDDELEIVVLCTNDTCKLESTINDVTYTAISYFVDRICECIVETDQYEKKNDWKPDFKDQVAELNCGRVHFVCVKIDEYNPKAGIERTVEWIRDNSSKVDGKFWIDTHGGFRDVSLVSNAIVSLLKVYNSVPDAIVGVRYGGTKEIINQESSFKMFDFVSGMNEFIQFGSADTLEDYYKNLGDGPIKKALSAMTKISDGTRLCDPKLYITGLDALAVCIDQVPAEDELFTIFVDYIKRDYGDLLDKKKRTNLKIIKRCLDKKLYQQALTFIESLMPEDFVSNKIVYYKKAYEGTIQTDRDNAKKKYLSVQHYFFDEVCRKLPILQQSFEQQLSRRGQISNLDFVALECLKRPQASIYESSLCTSDNN